MTLPCASAARCNPPNLLENGVGALCGVAKAEKASVLREVCDR